jgi:hypothetical protein
MIAAARRHVPGSPRTRGRFDVPGALASTFGVSVLI